MKTTKDVKITYHTIIKKLWKKPGKHSDSDGETTGDAPDEIPFYEINDVLKYIMKLSKKNKFYDIQGNKFCFLESYNEEVVNEDVCLYCGFFKSARNEFRPNLINKSSGIERPNPKELTEGDVEKTHFVIKTDVANSEVYLFLEKNFYGVNINNVINYLSSFAKQYFSKKTQPARFTLIHAEIPGANFLTELGMLTKTTLAEVYFDKKLLGGGALDFSNRFASLRKDILLTARATPKDSITDVAIDLYNKYKKGSISRIRIRGVDDNKHEIVLDTLLLCKTDTVTVDKNSDTGEVNTAKLCSELKKIANSF